MRLLSINAKTLAITALETETFLETAYDHIKTHVVDVVRVSDNIDIWIDDNGRISPSEDVRLSNDHVYGFLLETKDGLKLPLAGHIIITGGADDDGNTLGTDLQPEQVKNEVFLDRPHGVEQAPLGFTLTPCYVPLL